MRFESAETPACCWQRYFWSLQLFGSRQILRRWDSQWALSGGRNDESDLSNPEVIEIKILADNSLTEGVQRDDELLREIHL